MKIVNLTCPGCGARLEVDMDRKMAFCSYCGAALPVDDEIQKVQLDGAEKAGYEFEKGRQRAQAEAAQASFRLSKPAISQLPNQRDTNRRDTNRRSRKFFLNPSRLPANQLLRLIRISRPLKSPRRSAKRGCVFWGGSAFSPFRSRLSC